MKQLLTTYARFTAYALRLTRRLVPHRHHELVAVGYTPEGFVVYDSVRCRARGDAGWRTIR